MNSLHILIFITQLKGHSVNVSDSLRLKPWTIFLLGVVAHVYNPKKLKLKDCKFKASLSYLTRSFSQNKSNTLVPQTASFPKSSKLRLVGLPL